MAVTDWLNKVVVLTGKTPTTEALGYTPQRLPAESNSKGPVKLDAVAMRVGVLGETLTPKAVLAVLVNA